MGLLKYYYDTEKRQPDGSIHCINTKFGFGAVLAAIKECPTRFGPRMVYMRGEADTAFSVPAACTFRGRVIRGYMFSDDGVLKFRPYRGVNSVYPWVDE